MELSHARQSTLQVLQAQTERVQAHLMPCKQLCCYISTKKSLSTLLWEHGRNKMHGRSSKGRNVESYAAFSPLLSRGWTLTSTIPWQSRRPSSVLIPSYNKERDQPSQPGLHQSSNSGMRGRDRTINHGSAILSFLPQQENASYLTLIGSFGRSS